MRWSVDGRQRSKSFRTKSEADRYRSQLFVVVHAGGPFDEQTGLPCAWSLDVAASPVRAWVRRWLREQWPEWQPRTRASAVEALARFVALTVAVDAPAPPEGLRAHLVGTLGPDSAVDGSCPEERWLQHWGLTLDQLDRSQLADVDRRLGLGDEGQPLSAWTASRYR